MHSASSHPFSITLSARRASRFPSHVKYIFSPRHCGDDTYASVNTSELVIPLSSSTATAVTGFRLRYVSGATSTNLVLILSVRKKSTTTDTTRIVRSDNTYSMNSGQKLIFNLK